MQILLSQIASKLSDYKDKIILKAVNWALSLMKPIKFSEVAWAIASYSILCFQPLADGSPDWSKPVPEYSSYDVQNLVVDYGRQQVTKYILNITSPAAPVAGFPFLGVGSDLTAAAHGQATLIAELAGNANRLTLTNTSGNAFDDADIVAETSGAFFWKCIAQAIYPAGDGNNGSVFGEFGLYTTASFATDLMYNRIVNPSPFTKSASLAVVVQVSLRS